MSNEGGHVLAVPTGRPAASPQTRDIMKVRHRLPWLALTGLCLAACSDDPGPAPDPAACGDGAVDTGEQCDDGNITSGDGCSASCRLETASSTCGDGIVEESEVCDDGNNMDGDGCAAVCDSDETCGNDIVDAAAGETCDDGNTTDGDGCNATCTGME